MRSLLARLSVVVGRPADLYSGFGSYSSGRLLPLKTALPGEPTPRLASGTASPGPLAPIFPSRTSTSMYLDHCGFVFM